jgi:hypothetical protein
MLAIGGLAELWGGGGGGGPGPRAPGVRAGPLWGGWGPGGGGGGGSPGPGAPGVRDGKDVQTIQM